MKHVIKPALLLMLFTQAVNAQTNYALVFGNSNDYVSIPNAAASSVTTEATFEAWVKPATDNETGRIIDNFPSGNYGFLLDLQNGYPRMIFTSSFGVTATTALSAGQWYHIAVTANNTADSLNIYINGVLNNTSVMYGSNAANTAPVYLGRDQDGNNHFLGAMDEIRIWNVARTASQIQASMNSNLLGNESGLIGYWPLNEGSGTTTNDRTSNANNGTLNNFSLTSTSGWVADTVVTLYAGPSAGDGTSSNPYTIASLNNLYWLSQNSAFWGSYFIQTADIDADSTQYWDSGSGCSPIGNSTTNFTGHYNGKGHAISGLYINRASTNYVGLFGYIGSTGTVDSLSVSNSTVTGAYYVGALAGVNSGTIRFSSAPEGSVTGIHLVGGLTGWNQVGAMSSCYSSGTVTGTSSNIAYGGLVGWSDGNTISDCYSLSSVTAGSGSRVGGLVGFLYTGTVKNCYATGSVSGSSSVGGLVGMSSGTVTNCFYNTEVFTGSTSYGTGKTTTEMKTASTYIDAGWDFAGETANGKNDYWGINNIDNNGYPCFLGQLTAPMLMTQPLTDYTGTTATANGTLAYLGSSAVTAHGFCWSSTNTTPTLADSKVNSGAVSDTGSFSVSITGLTSGTVYCFRAYAINATDTVYGVAVTNLASLTTLAISSISDTAATFNGKITQNPGSVSSYGFCWSSTNSLPTIADDTVDLGVTNYTVTFSANISNLTASTTYYVRAYAKNSAGITYGACVTFTTIFAGNGTITDPYQISNLADLQLLSKNSSYWSSSFIQTADIDASATSGWDSGSGFSPIGDDTYNFTGSYNGKGHSINGLYINRSLSIYVGFFGYTKGATIDSLGLTNGRITGTSYYVGGISGYSHSSTISNCYNTGSVSGPYLYFYVGGIAGFIYSSTIRNCYNTGSVSGYGCIGGIAGSNDGSTIRNCYNTGSVSGKQGVGGIAGDNYSKSWIYYCYSSGSVSGSSYVGAVFGAVVNCYINYCFYNNETSGQSDSYATGLSTAQMKHPAPFSGYDFSGTWAIREDSTYPVLRSMDNAPFAFAETISPEHKLIPEGVAVSGFIANDYDYETVQENLVYQINSISAGTISDGKIYFPSTFSYGDLIKVTYRVGEIRSSQQDTLWGNIATNLLVYTNHNPECNDTSITVEEDTPVNIWLATDADDDLLSYTTLSTTLNGTTLIRNDSLYYTPDANFYGNDSLHIAVSDGISSDTVWIHITLTSVNDVPFASDSTVTTTEGTAIAVALNATDVDGTVKTIVIDTYPANGNIKVSGTTLTYTPDADFVGIDTLTWYAFDNSGDYSNTATLVINVIAKPTYTITASAGNGGSISPSGDVSVKEGSGQSFTIAANTGYTISDVLVDGTSAGAVSSYAFSSVTANHTITASFKVTTGVEENGLSDISIYPNPCSTGFTIHAGEKESTLYILDLTGKIVISKQVSGRTYVDTDALKAGVYLVKAEGVTYKLIKE